MILLHLGGTRRQLTIDPSTRVNTPPDVAREVDAARAAVAAASPGVRSALERHVAAADDQFLLISSARTLEAFIAALGDATTVTDAQLAARWLEAERATGAVEANRAMLELVAVELPPALRGTIPALGLGPSAHGGKSPGERNRVAAEAASGSSVLMSARPEAQRIVERLVALHGGRLQFPFIAQLERFLDGLGDAPLTDDEIRARWLAHADASPYA